MRNIVLINVQLASERQPNSYLHVVSPVKVSNLYKRSGSNPGVVVQVTKRNGALGTPWWLCARLATCHVKKELQRIPKEKKTGLETRYRHGSEIRTYAWLLGMLEHLTGQVAYGY
jgi:hypothetical protein